jgi:hypothetical protein
MSRTPEFWLSIIFLAIIAAIYTWDAYVLTSHDASRSVSHVIRAWSVNQPILPFAAGVLVGHLFW